MKNKFLLLEKKYQIIIISMGIIIVIGLGLLFGNFIRGNTRKVSIKSGDDKKIAETTKEKTDAKEKVDSKSIVIYITGAVLNKGVYEFKDSDRIADALDKAVLSEDAETSGLNLAAYLEDEMKINVPKKGENTNDVQKNIEASGKTDSGVHNKININRGDKTKLEEITGVGPKLAEEIINYRDSKGPFKRIEDIKNVTGIGETTFQKIKNEISV